ncbi:MAG: branched-chain amino acid ABC transporter permease [Anaerolineae bacterium]|nr:branched-chain amino acid ABC transporter permease [Anaerolineae bacterium]
MLTYFANLSPQHRRSWGLVVAYVALLLAVSYVDFGYNTAGQTAFRGILLGMLVFMVASGLSLIFGLLDVLNFAQGAFLLIGAYVGYDVYTSLDAGTTVRFLAAIVSGVVFVGVLGAIMETGLIRPLYDRPVFQIVLTFGLAAVLLDLVERYYGPDPKQPLDPPGFLDNNFTLFDQSLSYYRLFIIFLGLTMMVGVFLLLNRTRIGIIIRAGVQDSEMVQALGINVRLIFTLVFVLGAALAALGGIALVPYQGATLEMGNQFLILAIVVIVIGGMGSYEGTAIASIVVGLTRAVAEQLSLEHFDAPVLAETSILLLMIVVLLVQPSGLFGREE